MLFQGWLVRFNKKVLGKYSIGISSKLSEEFIGIINFFHISVEIKTSRNLAQVFVHRTCKLQIST